MKRLGFCLAVIAGSVAGTAAGQGMRPAAPQDQEPPWLIQINVMHYEPTRIADPLDRFRIAVGDWVELSAALPTGSGRRDRSYKVEASIQGEAVEQFAAVRPAALTAIAIKEGVGYTETSAPSPVGERRLILMGKKAGKATIRTTVSRGGSWKETREFEVTVTEQREESPGFQ